MAAGREAGHGRKAIGLAAGLGDVLLFAGIFLAIIHASILLRLSGREGIRMFAMPAQSYSINDRTGYCAKLRKYTNFLLSMNLPCFRLSCMKRALIYCRFLNLAGIGAGLCFGVRRGRAKEGGLMHAWASVNGEAFPKKSDCASAFRKVCCFPAR